MKKTLLTVVLLAFSWQLLLSQSTMDSSNMRPMNNVNLSFIGDVSVISINYERLFLVKSNSFITGKLGVGFNQEFQICFSSNCGPPENFTTIPHHITANVGKGKHFFEFGLGGTFISGNDDHNYLLYPIIGYRLQPIKSNRVNLRVFGVIHQNTNASDFYGDVWLVPLGLSFGVIF